MRYWPAGERCPHQVLVLFELLRFDLDTEKISAAPGKDDTVTTNEKICMTPANTEKISAAPFKDDTVTTNENICMTTAKSMNEKTCMSASTMNEKSMNEKTLHEKSNICMNEKTCMNEKSMNEKTLHEKSTDKLVPTYKMKRYKFKKTFQPTTIHVSWIWENLSAEIVLEHMGQYGPCMLEDWDFPGHTATIKYEDPQDAQRALSAKDEDVKMVPAES